tara:strand:+ start:77327 stop:79342 length:2016 start_codon:yes stop_codon:yes gene_type:complete
VDTLKKRLKWGILASNEVARNFAIGLRGLDEGEVIAIGNQDRNKIQTFPDEFKIPRLYNSYEKLLDDPEVQAVYIATPHATDTLWAVRAAEAGKHILCENPLALNHAEAMAIVEAAYRKNVFLMEAFTCRGLPQTNKIIRSLRNGSIGEIRELKFSCSLQKTKKSPVLNRNPERGGSLEVGYYAISMSRLVAGVANGKALANPIAVEASGKIKGGSGVKKYPETILTFSGGITVHINNEAKIGQENLLKIFGTKGKIEIPYPWKTNLGSGKWSFTINRYSVNKPEEIRGQVGNLYELESCKIAKLIAAGKKESPTSRWQDTLDNMIILDRWREAIGLEFPKEKITFNRSPIHGRPLKNLPKAPIPRERIDGFGKSISRLVMGTDNQANLSHASIMFDDFVEQGGNCFDTAHIYGRGFREKLLGQWIKNRGNREELVIIIKGAHSPLNFPEYITSQLFESLENLNTDYADIYFLHRDNPEVPAGEFVEVLNHHYRAGRIKVFGGSNWTTQRIEEANEYADKHRIQRFTVWSNNFSLARMVKPVWAGCISASDSESRQWLEKNQMPLFPWSSQARGFFTEQAEPGKRNDENLVKSWYSKDNFQRRQRAIELASEKGVLPINIALAYVLCQPFPTFPLFGPRLLSETRTSIPAVNVPLTKRELQYLNLEKNSTR